MQQNTDFIIRLRSVIERTGLKKTAIYARIKDGNFPAPISLGARAVGWLESDVDRWIADRVAASRGTK